MQVESLAVGIAAGLGVPLIAAILAIGGEIRRGRTLEVDLQKLQERFDTHVEAEQLAREKDYRELRQIVHEARDKITNPIALLQVDVARLLERVGVEPDVRTVR